ncbi:MAG: ABC transporter permease [Desulfurococcaceae archaeon]
MAVRGKAALRALVHFKSFIAGLIIIVFFISLSVYAAVTWPFEEAIAKWNNAAAWADIPEWAPPAWIQYFTGRKEIVGSLYIDRFNVPRRFVNMSSEVLYGGLEIRRVEINFTYDYDVFPRSGRLSIQPVPRDDTELTKNIGVRVTLVKPNGLSILLYEGLVSPRGTTIGIIRQPGEEHPVVRRYRVLLRRAYDVNLTVSLDPVQVLFMDDEEFINSNQTSIRPLKGSYMLVYEYIVVTGLETLEVQLLLRGTLYGLLGTDWQGKDLFMGIAWGAPIALSFGLLASLITTLLIMVIAATAAWFRGAVDEGVSRVNEIFMIIPFLPTLVLIMLFYGFTVWTLLLMVIFLSTLGSGGLKTQRAMFLQIREMPYIEAARAYGASSFRIVFRYMVPRVLPVLIPGIVTSVPSFVFLEAALALLGISDPRTITWGKILNEALEKQALFVGAYHWILAPSVSLMLLSIAFAMIGFTLDRVFNPRLRQL